MAHVVLMKSHDVGHRHDGEVVLGFVEDLHRRVSPEVETLYVLNFRVDLRQLMNRTVCELQGVDGQLRPSE